MYRGILKAKDDFLVAASRTYESRIQNGTGGNLSVRIPGTDLMIVKPSGFSYGQCSEENITITDFRGNLQEGLYKPTRDPPFLGCNLYAPLPQNREASYIHTALIPSLISLNDMVDSWN